VDQPEWFPLAFAVAFLWAGCRSYWSDISAKTVGGWREHVELRFARVPAAHIQLYGKYPEIVELASRRS